MRHKNGDWNLPERPANWEQVSIAVLMDIRDELQALNRVLHCYHFLNIPHKLDAIRRNTAKKRRKVKK